MITRCVVILIVLCIVLASCSFPAIETSPITETPTLTMTIELPTATVLPEITIEITKIDTVVPTETPGLPLVPSKTPELPLVPSPTPFPDVWYIPQPGTPLATFNTVHEAAGCSWLGVGGQVFGPDTSPVLGLNILVSGTLEGHQVGSLGMTGMETNIGEGGYEITLADHPVDSRGTLWMQIVDDKGNPLSERISFDTINDCDQNFILINFVRYQPPLAQGNGWMAYLPIVVNQLSFQVMPTP